MGELVRTPAPAAAAERPAYLPTADHGVIGDLRTVGLAGVGGIIDWYAALVTPGRLESVTRTPEPPALEVGGLVRPAIEVG